jgi:hypothetical protein
VGLCVTVVSLFGFAIFLIYFSTFSSVPYTSLAKSIVICARRIVQLTIKFERSVFAIVPLPFQIAANFHLFFDSIFQPLYTTSNLSKIVTLVLYFVRAVLRRTFTRFSLVLARMLTRLSVSFLCALQRCYKCTLQ